MEARPAGRKGKPNLKRELTLVRLKVSWSDSPLAARTERVVTAEAAATLRRYLEHVGFVLSDGLKASVTFRADGNYTLNDLLPPGFSQARKDMKSARAAAQSWGKTELEEEIGTAIEALSALVAATQADNWMTNASVHYNEWANLEATEFAEVVKAFRSVIEFLQCDTCDALPHAVFNGAAREQIKCTCGEKTFDLTKKAA